MISSISYFCEICVVDIQWNGRRKQHRGKDKACIICTLDSQFSNHWDITVLMTPIHFVILCRIGNLASLQPHELSLSLLGSHLDFRSLGVYDSLTGFTHAACALLWRCLLVLCGALQVSRLCSFSRTSQLNFIPSSFVKSILLRTEWRKLALGTLGSTLDFFFLI